MEPSMVHEQIAQVILLFPTDVKKKKRSNMTKARTAPVSFAPNLAHLRRW